MTGPFRQRTNIDRGVVIDIGLGDPTVGTATAEVHPHEGAHGDLLGTAIVFPRSRDLVLEAPLDRRDVGLYSNDAAFRTRSDPLLRSGSLESWK